MAEIAAASYRPAQLRFAFWPIAAVIVLALLLTLVRLAERLPFAEWRYGLFSPDATNLNQLITYYSFEPRLFVSMLAGAALALAGVLFQQVLRNPIAEPTTLGVSAGAGLALQIATVWSPSLLAFGQEAVALGGAAIATIIVFGLAWNRAFSPLSLILGGLVVNFVAGGFSGVISLFKAQYLVSMFLWGSGSLHQNDWSAVIFLLPRVLIAWSFSLFLIRPLTVLSIEDEGADPPPLNWSTLNYVFWQTGGPICRRSATSPKRSSRSCARSMCWSRRGNLLPMRSARSA